MKEWDEELANTAVRAVEQSPIGPHEMVRLIQAIAKRVQAGDMPEQILERIETPTRAWRIIEHEANTHTNPTTRFLFERLKGM